MSRHIARFCLPLCFELKIVESLRGGPLTHYILTQRANDSAHMLRLTCEDALCYNSLDLLTCQKQGGGGLCELMDGA